MAISRRTNTVCAPCAPGCPHDIGPAAARATTFANALAAAEVITPGEPLGSGPVERSFDPMRSDGPGDEPHVLHHRGHRDDPARESRMRGNAAMLEAKKSRLSPEGAARIAAAAKARAERQRADREAAALALSTGPVESYTDADDVDFGEGAPNRHEPLSPACIDPGDDEPNVEPVSGAELVSVRSSWTSAGSDPLVEAYRVVREMRRQFVTVDQLLDGIARRIADRAADAA